MAVKKKAVRKKTVARKKKPAKRPVRKATKAKAKKSVKIVKKAKENIVGAVTHYFPHVQAAVIKLKAPVAVGDKLKFKGHTTDFTQNIASMQIDHVPVASAKKGEEIGLLVNSRVREHDTVIKE
ncbi:MAG: hypothetical protein PHF11_05295 [Candidatus Omnitrophica bacterium]|nr:hypothetical protein [Candidatus Omnitrophota bacterium]